MKAMKTKEMTLDDAEEENVEGRKHSSLKISDKDLRRHCLHIKRKRYLH